MNLSINEDYKSDCENCVKQCCNERKQAICKLAKDIKSLLIKNIDESDKEHFKRVSVFLSCGFSANTES